MIQEKSKVIDAWIRTQATLRKSRVVYAHDVAEHFTLDEIEAYLDDLVEHESYFRAITGISPHGGQAMQWSGPSHVEEEDVKFWQENAAKMVGIRGMNVYYFFVT